MNRLVFTSRIDANGVLAVNVPVGKKEANREVKITVEPVEHTSSESEKNEAWQQFIAETAGRWQGELQRPEQGELERRDSWP